MSSMITWLHVLSIYIYICVLHLSPITYFLCANRFLTLTCRFILTFIAVHNSFELNYILQWVKLRNLTFIFLITYIYFDSFDQIITAFFLIHLTKILTIYAFDLNIYILFSYITILSWIEALFKFQQNCHCTLILLNLKNFSDIPLHISE